jgi:hypothetical protein
LQRWGEDDDKKICFKKVFFSDEAKEDQDTNPVLTLK